MGKKLGTHVVHLLVLDNGDVHCGMRELLRLVVPRKNGKLHENKIRKKALQQSTRLTVLPFRVRLFRTLRHARG